MQLNNFLFLCSLQFGHLILNLFWGHFLLSGALKAIFGVGVGFKTVLGSTHVVEQLLFSMIP